MLLGQTPVHRIRRSVEISLSSEMGVRGGLTTHCRGTWTINAVTVEVESTAKADGALVRFPDLPGAELSLWKSNGLLTSILH
jgi:hypothetical protein